MKNDFDVPADLILGTELNDRVPRADQIRQRAEVDEIVRRLQVQPGVILADEVGMGKTFVALAVAYAVGTRSDKHPVVVMVPANLVDKWEQDLSTFCELYLKDRVPLNRGSVRPKELRAAGVLRYGIARHSVDFMKLLDDPRSVRCHIIFLAQGAMGRRQSDKWVRLALIAEALRRHARGGARRLIQVREQIHRFVGQLLSAVGEERAHGWGEEMWRELMKAPPMSWRDTYNDAIHDDRYRLHDDPVPKSVIGALKHADLKPLAKALEEMPVRAKGGGERMAERLGDARSALKEVEEILWKQVLAEARWRSPLLVMDEAHHLKNPGTALARQLQSPDADADLKTGDGAMARAFDRMLFLTATPFQLGNRELVRVLERFGDVRWDAKKLGDRDAFLSALHDLGDRLDRTQRAAIGLQQAWRQLRPEDCNGDPDEWWRWMRSQAKESLTHHQRAVLDAFESACGHRDQAEGSLKPWIVRHNKGDVWADTTIARRQRVRGGEVVGAPTDDGIPIPPEQLLPFFLAARSAADPRQDLLGEALSSSYEAFRETRRNQRPTKDDGEGPIDEDVDLSHSKWYLDEFDSSLERYTGAAHPKIAATVKQVVDLWEQGEKVLVFAFYRHTCRALRVHISNELERRTMSDGHRDAARLIDRVQQRFFDSADSKGRRAVGAELDQLLVENEGILTKGGVSAEQRAELTEVMRRYLRVATTLVRCFPLRELDSIEPEVAVRRTLDHQDGSGQSWREKFDGFVKFISKRCSGEERKLYLEAALQTQTGKIRVEAEADEDEDASEAVLTLPNIQVATGATRREARSRLMRAFNTPFFPDILVCSQVMGEGVDLQNFCRHVIHHDLAWNPSSIEQRTGRIDRLGCKAEGRNPILVYLPFLAGTADERQYRVMSEREQWFRVVMGEDKVAELITPDSQSAIALPVLAADELSFRLGLSKDR